jgi:hypothetical protein
VTASERLRYDPGRNGRSAPKGQRETIVALLETLHDVTLPDGHGYGRGNPFDDRLLLLSEDYHAGSYRELEQLLGWMRNQARQRAYKGWGLGTLRWHVLAWHVDAPYVPKLVPKTVLRHGKRRVLLNADGKPELHPVRIVRRHRDARLDRAVLGVEWLELEWLQRLGVGFRPPQLPVRKAA